MRVSSSALTSAQVALNKPPIWKVVLARAAASTRGYDNTRVIKISHPETPTGNPVELVLNNSDGILTSLDFEHYQAVISYGYNTGASRSARVAASTYAIDDMVIPPTANGYQYRCSVAGTSGAGTITYPTSLGDTVADSAVTWEMDGNSGEEYSRAAPLRVRVQELHSGRGILRCILRPEGILDQLAEDRALVAYTQTSADTNTVKTLITAVAAATLSSYSGYTAYTVSYDSEDTVISSFIPADYFSVQINENRFEKIQELLDYTGCKMRIQNDGQPHILDPVVSGTAYNYEYKFNVAGDHNFWNKTVRLRFVNPNQEIVASHPDHTPQYSGSATSATSYALAPKTHTTYRRLPSNAVASSIASAIIERYELDAEKGFATVPMNVGQELWDYVKVTDSRQGDTRTGNIQFLQRNVEVHFDGKPLTWTMMLSFGKVSVLSLMANMLSAGAGGAEAIARLTDAQILEMIDALFDNQKILFANDKILDDNIDILFAREQVPKWHVTEQLIIPVE